MKINSYGFKKTEHGNWHVWYGEAGESIEPNDHEAVFEGLEECLTWLYMASRDLAAASDDPHEFAQIKNRILRGTKLEQ